MMKLIDTHCHLYLEEFDPEQDLLIRRAEDSGIGALLMPNVDVSTIDRMHLLCDRYPGYAYPMMGLHPSSVNRHYAESLRKIEACLSERTYCAIGEIGIDLYWDKTYRKEQIAVFEEQLRWSADLNLPVAIHTRNAFAEVFDSIYKVGAGRLSGVFHSFSGTVADWEEIRKLPRFKIGINGVVTFKNAGLPEVIRVADIHHILLETDAPYLAPVPYRGKRNEPVYIWKTAGKIAEIYNLSLEETVEITGRNALKIFPRILPAAR
jgi:TatD DNase family protein